MNITCVHIHVKEEHIDDFIAATVANHKGAIKEAGNLRFDALQSTEDPTKFMLYEVYESDETALAHKQTEHYLTWRSTVADWMAEPRVGIPYEALCPRESADWKSGK